MRLSLPHIRLSGTSFLLHESYVPAVRFTAQHCEDVALLLTETGSRGEYLPTPEEIREIRAILAGEGATLHVHLPTDANCDTPQDARRLAAKARLAIARTESLQPHSFVLHLDFPSLAGTGRTPSSSQRSWTFDALHDIASVLPSPRQLALENLEGFPPNFWDCWLEGTSSMRCVDIGHIWKDGGDPSIHLQAWLPETRIIHLHGLEPQGDEDVSRFPYFQTRPHDHVALAHVPTSCLDAVMHPLWRAGFSGVLNLEVFSFDAFTRSHTLLRQSWERFSNEESPLSFPKNETRHNP